MVALRSAVLEQAQLLKPKTHENKKQGWRIILISLTITLGEEDGKKVVFFLNPMKSKTKNEYVGIHTHN